MYIKEVRTYCEEAYVCRCPSTNLCAINNRASSLRPGYEASFLPVKSSTVNLLTSGVLAIVQALDDEV